MIKRIGKPSAPTTTQMGLYQQAFDYFNKKLWSDRLTPCMLVFSRRKARNHGHFCPKSWEGPTGKTHEIALNAAILKKETLRSIFSTLVHEMAHQWQFDHGEKFSGAYHNKEWGAEMDRIGLAPSNTGEPGGKRTGYQMTHYIVDGGLFDLAFREMPQEISLPWTSGGDTAEAPEPKPTGKDKVKYCCQCCAVWGKPEIDTLWCMTCSGKMTGPGSGILVNDWEWNRKAESIVLAFAKLACLDVMSSPEMTSGCTIRSAESHHYQTWVEALLDFTAWMPRGQGFDFHGEDGSRAIGSYGRNLLGG